MFAFKRSDFHYTAFFCEENIWLLAKALADQRYDIDKMQVLFLANPVNSLPVYQQLLAPAGQPVYWDYHVILLLTMPDSAYLFDLDSRLDFPCEQFTYLQRSFYDQQHWPEKLKPRVRIIPAGSYLRHFSSDRSHMRNLLPASEFPDYPPIQAAAGDNPVTLADYRNFKLQLDDGSQTGLLQDFFPQVIAHRP